MGLFEKVEIYPLTPRGAFPRLPSWEGWGWVQAGTDYKFVPAEKGPLQAPSPDLSVSSDLGARIQRSIFSNSPDKDDCER